MNIKHVPYTCTVKLFGKQVTGFDIMSAVPVPVYMLLKKIKTCFKPIGKLPPFSLISAPDSFLQYATFQVPKQRLN